MTSPGPDEGRSEQGGRTIILSESDVECAQHLLRLLTGEDAAPAAEQRVATEPGGRRQLLLARAEKIIDNRRVRSEYFHRAMFGETAWDILLLLYVTEFAGARQTQAALSKRLATPPTTVQRWVDYLEKEHLVRREPHPTDRRTAFVGLLDKGRNALENYLAAVVDPK